jgi:hypothetical protein
MIACTISPTGAVISADSWLYETTPEYRALSAQAAAVTYDVSVAEASRHGDPHPTVKLLGNVLKIFPLPQFCMLMAVTGPNLFGLNWSLTLSSVLAAKDIDDLHAVAPAMLRQLHQELRAADGVIVIHAGWSEKRRSGVGYQYSSSDGFAGGEIAAGETVTPAPDRDGENYPQVSDLWNSPEKSDDRAMALHRALFVNLQAAWLAGKLLPGTAIGGWLHQAKVNAKGISITTAPKARTGS